jgi:hypothetical protein
VSYYRQSLHYEASTQRVHHIAAAADICIEFSSRDCVGTTVYIEKRASCVCVHMSGVQGALIKSVH